MEDKEQMSTEQIGYWQLLRENRNYARLYFARVVSLFGDWFNLLAVLALLRAIGHEGAGVFGGIFIAKSVANLVMLPFSGVIVDRLSRRKVMILSDLGRALVVGLMFLVFWFPSIWLVYGLLLLQSALSAFFEPARSALLPDIVLKRELTAANALGAATWSTMLAIGSATGGIFTEIFGWEWALVVDIGTYIFSAYLLLKIKEPQIKFKKTKIDFLYDMQEGLIYLKNRFEVWTMAVVKALWSIVGSVSVLLALLGEGKYMLEAGAMISVSVLFVARGLGTGLGPIISRSLSKSDPHKMERFITYGFLVGAIFYALIPFAQTIWVVIILLILAHIGGATIWVFSSIRLQQLVETEVRGRIFAWELVFFLLVNIVSIYVYSWLLDNYTIEPDQVFGILGVSLLLPVNFWLWRMRKMKALSDQASK